MIGSDAVKTKSASEMMHVGPQIISVTFASTFIYHSLPPGVST
jgi:hypothetical protein